MKTNSRSSILDTPIAQARLQTFLQDGDCLPVEMAIFLTGLCNHKCNFCYEEFFMNPNQVSHKYIDLDLVRNLIREFGSFGSKLIITGGGEPLLHKHIAEILKEIIDLNIQTSLYTNLDVDIHKKGIVSSLQALTKINVNLNTLDEKLYSSSRGKHANINNVLKNLESLSDIKEKIVIQIVTNEDTIDTIEEQIELLLKKKLFNIHVCTAFETRYLNINHSSNKLIDKLQDLKENFIDVPQIQIQPPINSAVINGKEVFCNSHYFDVAIATDGCVYPCCSVCYLERYKIVDLNNYPSFVSAWQSEERRSFLTASKFNCKQCWFACLNSELLRLKTT